MIEVNGLRSSCAMPAARRPQGGQLLRSEQLFAAAVQLAGDTPRNHKPDRHSDQRNQQPCQHHQILQIKNIGTVLRLSLFDGVLAFVEKQLAQRDHLMG